MCVFMIKWEGDIAGCRDKEVKREQTEWTRLREYIDR